MTGICGVAVVGGPPLTTEDLAPVIDRLRRIGPDGTSAWSGLAGHRQLVVAAARRSRTGEDDADRQPVVVADGQVAVAADVVLDDRAELCRALGLRDGPGVADPEIVAHAYLRWGEGMAERLHGELAVAVADRREGGILLVRDRLGRRPLFVHRGRGRLSFASTAFALSALAGVPAEIDEIRFRQYLGLAMVTDCSWVRDVVPVPPATVWWLGGPARPTRRYWRLDVALDRQASFAEHADRLRHALDVAVASRVDRRRGAVGVLLSGGLDSSAVAATAAGQVRPERVRTYTAVPPSGWTGADHGKEPDEGPLVRRLAERHPNLVPAMVGSRGEPFLSVWDDLFDAGTTPPRQVGNIPWIHAGVREAAADGVGLLLWGTAGNMAFSADDWRWLVDLLARGHLWRAAREARAWADATGSGLGRVVGRDIVLPGLPGRARHVLGPRFRAGGGPFERRRRTASLRPDARAGAELDRGLISREDPRSVLLDRVGPANTAVIGENAEFHAGLSGIWGLRSTDPLADERVLEAAAAQPSWHRRRKGLGRAVAREAMADRVPDEIRLRTVRGAQLPDWADRVAESADEWIEELDRVRDHPVTRRSVDVDRLAGIVGRASGLDSQAGLDERLCHLVVCLRGLVAGRYVRWFERQRPDASAAAFEAVGSWPGGDGGMKDRPLAPFDHMRS